MNKTIQTERKTKKKKQKPIHTANDLACTPESISGCVLDKYVNGYEKRRRKKQQLQFTTVPREVPDIDAKPCAYADILRTFPIVCVFIINSRSIQRLLSRPIFFIVYDCWMRQQQQCNRTIQSAFNDAFFSLSICLGLSSSPPKSGCWTKSKNDGMDTGIRKKAIEFADDHLLLFQRNSHAWIQ